MRQSDAARVEAVLDRLLPPDGDCEQADAAAGPARNPAATLAQAMRYAVLGGGKRLRPRLAYAAGRAAGASAEEVDFAAAAVELVHAFSLIHDDLPALDDDALRRGRPTVHVRFGEATAILAGDALLALAFETASDAALAPDLAAGWVRLLARATGAEGMVGGQMMDLAGEAERLPLLQVADLHRRKTGALIHAATMAGAAAGRLPAEALAAVDSFAAEIGLAFQIQDDVLDATASTGVLGKPQQADARRGKSTYVSVLGLAAAEEEAARRLALARARLAPLGSRGAELASLAEEMVRRRF